MNKTATPQYTIRNIPERVDRRLRETAAQYGHSLNQAAVEALSRGLGVDQELGMHHDLDDLAGTWVADPEFDRAMKSMDRVDPDLWK
jgi:plasmid stability protein